VDNETKNIYKFKTQIKYIEESIGVTSKSKRTPKGMLTLLFLVLKLSCEGC
jgi:hypothetical protein